MFSKEFKKRRKTAGYTQKTFSEVAGVSRQTVQKWETGSMVPDRVRWELIDKLLGEKEGWANCIITGSTIAINITAPAPKITGIICQLPNGTNKHQSQITEWIDMQDEPSVLWGEIKSDLRRKEPDFAEFLKKTSGDIAQNG